MKVGIYEEGEVGRRREEGDMEEVMWHIFLYRLPSFHSPASRSPSPPSSPPHCQTANLVPKARSSPASHLRRLPLLPPRPNALLRELQAQRSQRSRRFRRLHQLVSDHRWLCFIPAFVYHRTIYISAVSDMTATTLNATSSRTSLRKRRLSSNPPRALSTAWTS